MSKPLEHLRQRNTPLESPYAVVILGQRARERLEHLRKTVERFEEDKHSSKWNTSLQRDWSFGRHSECTSPFRAPFPKCFTLVPFERCGCACFSEILQCSSPFGAVCSYFSNALGPLLLCLTCFDPFRAVRSYFSKALVPSSGLLRFATALVPFERFASVSQMPLPFPSGLFLFSNLQVPFERSAPASQML